MVLFSQFTIAFPQQMNKNLDIKEENNIFAKAIKNKEVVIQRELAVNENIVTNIYFQGIDKNKVRLSIKNVNQVNMGGSVNHKNIKAQFGQKILVSNNELRKEIKSDKPKYLKFEFYKFYLIFDKANEFRIVSKKIKTAYYLEKLYFDTISGKTAFFTFFQPWKSISEYRKENFEEIFGVKYKDRKIVIKNKN